MLTSGEGLKTFYRFVANNPHIALHDACQIVIERPSASICFSFEEWNAQGRIQTDALKDRLNQDIAKLDEKMKRLTRMRLEDEISKEEFLEYKSEIEKDREKIVQQRLAFEAGVETGTDSESIEGKIQNFLLQKMDFTEHYVDRDIISQFVDTVIPRSETCYEWYMDFDLIEKPNEKKKMVWSFKIDYNEAKTYRKEREGMLRPNQWEDLIVRVYI